MLTLHAMGSYVLGLREVDQTDVATVGGKGAHLGELSRIEGISVPAGFCVTTDAFRRSVQGAPIPAEVAAAVASALAELGGDGAAFAVRSSATAEDLPTASFAGQHDTFLNIRGTDAVLEHISRCWASLFTERAVAYRSQQGIDHRSVQMAVVVQQMVPADVSGVLFTADPLSGNRTAARVEAVPGLGEALVSGLVNPDAFTVRDDEVIGSAAAPERQAQAVLTEAEVVALVHLGRRIEAHFGCPQDIEWCLAGGRFHIVQSRPITTLFPIPEAGDGDNHVYVSVGHQQMMTDAMKPLGLSFWQMTTPRPMAEAGGRLFVDVTPILASPATCAGFLDMIGRSDPLIGDALQTVVEREGFLPPPPDEAPPAPPGTSATDPVETDPAIVADLMARTEASIAKAAHDIRGRSGTTLFDFIVEDMQELRQVLHDPQSRRVIMTGMEAAWWLNDRLEEWLGETNAADTLTKSVPHNVTSEMGLALLDVADVIRPLPEVVAFLHHAEDEGFLDDLAEQQGGSEARAAIEAFLDRYGMRCAGEIDITRPRWSERPTTLVPLILSNIKNTEPGERGRRFEQGRQEALAKEQDVLERLRALPDGEQKADDTKQMIDRVRTFSGFREHPKYGMICRYFVYKRALLEEADRLVRAQVLTEREDIFFLTFQELHDVARTDQADQQLIQHRREQFRSYEALTPPRVLTSDGEGVTGQYRRGDVPAGALVGLPVSAGTVEGRARVILDMAEADVDAGDILVTAFTDPSWSPLFVAVAGLVAEVGGQMTHGAVIAREYGLPAVVGVEQATLLIQDGQTIRVHGTDGYVEILA